MRYISKFLLVTIFLFFSITTTQAEDLKLTVVYPKEDAVINAESTFFIGNTDPRAELYINGSKTKVYENGSFVKVTPLKEGKNNIELRSTLNGVINESVIHLIRPEKPTSLPTKPMKVLEPSITPDEDIMYKPGDTIKVRFQGSPGYRATFSIGKRKNIQMRELPVRAAGIRGIYQGSYIIRDDDWFENDPITVKLSSRYARLTKRAKAKVSMLPKFEYILAKVKKDKITTRTIPYGSRLTPLPKGTVISITGKKGEHFRIMHANKPAWVNLKDIDFLSYSKTPAQSKVTAVDLIHSKNIEKIKIPLKKALPIDIRQDDSDVIVDIVGGTAFIDTIDYKQFKGYIKEIKWSQPSEDVFSLKISTNASQLWGYDYYYKGNDLFIVLKKCPVIDATNPLKGQVIAIDPGHGGEELGSVGPTEVPEKTVNLAISNYLKTELEQLGAKVVMTRTNDDENPDLYERSKIAKDNGALILLSIHNNALPDGKDPYETHGSSVYYYHPQALELAKNIQEAMVNELKLKDLGVKWGSLALTRPAEPVSILIEVAFMINPYEYAKLITPEFQKKSAISIKDGLIKYLKENTYCVR